MSRILLGIRRGFGPARDEGLQDRENLVGDITQGVVHHGVLRDLGLDEVQRVVERLEEQDEQAEDESDLEDREHQAEQAVDKSQRECLERLGDERGDQVEQQGGHDGDEYETDDVEHGRVQRDVLCEQGAQRLGEVERSPGRDQNRHQVDDLLDKSLGDAADDRRDKAEQKNDIQYGHILLNV